MGIHGDKSQQERDWVLNGKYHKIKTSLFIRIFTQVNGHVSLFVEFKHGKAPILIATDVASRGLG